MIEAASFRRRPRNGVRISSPGAGHRLSIRRGSGNSDPGDQGMSMHRAQAYGRLHQTDLPLIGGGSIDLADFCGQKLVLFFCPSVAATAEIASFAALADQFEKAGAWLLGVASRPIEVGQADGVHLGIGLDPDDAAFERLRALSPDVGNASRDEGAVFLIDRDGTIRDAWSGAGRAADALAAAREGP